MGCPCTLLPTTEKLSKKWPKYIKIVLSFHKYAHFSPISLHCLTKDFFHKNENGKKSKIGMGDWGYSFSKNDYSKKPLRIEKSFVSRKV